MAKRNLYLIIIIIALLLISTIVSPVMIVAEDTEEDSSIDMAATIGLTGFKWIYPGSSVNSEGQTLHNVHMNNPEDPYGAARDIMTYSYGVTPHFFFSINNRVFTLFIIHFKIRSTVKRLFHNLYSK